MSYDQERRERALETYKKMGWGENEVVKEIDMELWRMQESGGKFKDEK